MYCSACGKKCPEGARYCAYCGEKLPELAPEETLNEAAAPEAPPAPPEAAVSEPAPAAPVPDEPEQLEIEANEADEFDLDESEPEPAPVPDKAAPEGGPANPAYRMFQRPASYPRANDAETVRPLLSNPAQPPRGEAAVVRPEPEEAPMRRSERRMKLPAQYDEDEWVRPAKAQKEAPAAKDPDDEWADDRPARGPRLERDDERPLGPARGERRAEPPARPRPVRPVRPIPDDPDDDRPARPSRAWALEKFRTPRAQGKAVTASGGMVTPPARRSPVRSAAPAKPRKPGRDDLFFEDLEMPRENYYDEAAEDKALSRRIKTIVALALVAFIGIVAIWLAWMPGGQIFRARWGLGAPATAYKAMGDQERESGQIQRAADAYHNALKLDPENYEYALLVGQTQEMVGARDNALKAYMLCVRLKPTEVEPYKLLVDLYTVMGDSQSAENWRDEGYRQTLDASLAPAS